MPGWSGCPIQLHLQLLLVLERVGFIIPGLQIKTLKMTEIETFSPDLRQCLHVLIQLLCFFFFFFLFSWLSVACRS